LKKLISVSSEEIKNKNFALLRGSCEVSKIEGMTNFMYNIKNSSGTLSFFSDNPKKLIGSKDFVECQKLK